MTLRRVSEVTGIPITTLADMRKPNWAKRTIGHLDSVQAKIEALESEAVAEPAQ